MKKLFLSLLLIVMALPAAASESAYKSAALNWLNGLDMAQARFRQVDYQGHILQGTFYIDRPGRLRFEYDAPVTDKIVADGYLIHFYDGTSGQTASGPIGSTLADFILRDQADFDRKVDIKAVREQDQTVTLRLTQKDQPEMGELILMFQKSPFMLQGWRIIDAQGLTTDILLSDFQRVETINPALFRVDNRRLNE